MGGEKRKWHLISSLNIQVEVEEECPSPPKERGASERSKMVVNAETGRVWMVCWMSGPKLQSSSGWLEQWEHKKRELEKVREVDEGPIMMSPRQTE